MFHGFITHTNGFQEYVSCAGCVTQEVKHPRYSRISLTCLKESKHSLNSLYYMCFIGLMHHKIDLQNVILSYSNQFCVFFSWQP